jgi:hypothetical protein
VRLHDTQAHFHALVTARDDVAAIAARDAAAREWVDAAVAGDARLSAVERLDVYARMYFVRLHDLLRDEFARTAAVIGDQAFHGLVTEYLVACPPGHPSLREAGARLSAFLATHALAGERPWLAELARLERARLEVFDGRDAAPVSLAALRAVPPERFGALRFHLIPAHRLLAGRFTISETWRAAKDAANDSEPPAAGDAPPAEAPELLIVWRRDGEVLHRAAGAEEARWLPALADPAGLLFESLCAALAESSASDAAAAARAFELCAGWIADGVLVADL